MWTPDADTVDPGNRLPVCGDCWWRMVHRPPTAPGQRCAHGHPLAWFDPDDPEAGFHDADETTAAGAEA